MSWAILTCSSMLSTFSYQEFSGGDRGVVVIGLQRRHAHRSDERRKVEGSNIRIKEQRKKRNTQGAQRDKSPTTIKKSSKMSKALLDSCYYSEERE